MKKMETSKLILWGAIVTLLVMTVAYTIIFCVKGSYPELIFTTVCGAIVAELVLLWRIHVNKGKTEQGE